MRRHTLFLGLVLTATVALTAENPASPAQIISFDKEDAIILDDQAELEAGILTLDADLFKSATSVVDAEEKLEPEMEFSKIEKELARVAPEAEDTLDFTSFEREDELVTKAEKEKRPIAAKSAATKPLAAAPQQVGSAAVQVDLAQVFAGSPVIYSLLLSLSVFALFICLYNLLSLRGASDSFVKKIRQKLMSNQFDEALGLCLKNDQLFSKIVAAAISTRKYGTPHMLETMKAEGKRATVGFWQRIALLNDIAVIAPMLGLLGTVVGMFYAFYDLNRSRESVSTLFDGLGISVGTTVAGLIVAIIAMMLHALAKYRLVRALAIIEDEAQSLAALMDPKTSTPSEK